MQDVPRSSNQSDCAKKHYSLVRYMLIFIIKPFVILTKRANSVAFG